MIRNGIVAAAAAWVWTTHPGLDNTQLFEIMRLSAHDLQPTGFDRASGFGMLDIPKALQYPAPAPDPLEPNDDIDQVRPKGVFAAGTAPLTRPGRTSATIRARVDQHEDPRDVYRAYIAARGSLTAWTSGGHVALRIFRSAATSVDSSAAAGRTSPGALTYRAPAHRGGYVYVEVLSPRGVARTDYTLRVSARARR